MRARLLFAAALWSAAAITPASDSDSGRPARPVPQAPSRDLAAKSDAWVLDRFKADGEAEVLVVLRSQADVSGADSLLSKEARRSFVVEALRAQAERDQAAILRILDARGVSYRAFWVSNMIWVRAGADLAAELAERPEVARLSANPRVRRSAPAEEHVRGPERAEAASSIEPNLSQIHAPDMWSLGFSGQGAVVAGADTGYAWTHPALQGKYRGWDAATSTASHDYNWHDAIHSFGGSCGHDSPAPCDDTGHGTHTMGTMVGDDGSGNQTGVAPGAKWIGCRNMDQNVGTPATYAECFQFFLAPTDHGGNNPDPSKAPDAINDSWFCPPSEGCTDPNVLKTVVENVRAGGILVVSSAGNSGPTCSSIADPIAIYQAAFAVGAVDASDTIASFSSRGPVAADGSMRLKPDATAPGVGIRSSLPGGTYGYLSGTSMAGPHAVGTAALLLSAVPSLHGQVGALESLLKSTAVPRTSGETCGGVPGDQIPNNTYGWGRIDALAAYGGTLPDLAAALSSAPPAGAPAQDLVYTVDVSDAPSHAGASSVALTGTLPAGVAMGPVTATAGSCTVTYPTFSCSLGAIAAGASVAVTIHVTPAAPGPLTLTAAADAPESDADPTNDSASLQTQVEFSDVAPGNPFHDFIAHIARDGVSSGCGSGAFCPQSDVTRAQMAVFLLRAKNGPSYTPSPATGTIFSDVPVGSFAAAWIEALAAAAVTTGCGGGKYCPDTPVTRAQMAVFLLRTLHGSSYVPPGATGTVFTDVPASAFAAAWIERLSAEGLTAGCGGGNFCPSAAVSRAQMAVFLVSTFALP